MHCCATCSGVYSPSGWYQRPIQLSAPAITRSLILGWFDIGPEPEGRPVQAPAGLDETLEAVEKRHILAVLAAADGNKSEASRRLGISRKTMDRKCQAWGI